jgi:hypothetical protein
MGSEGLPYGGILQARLRDALMARGATIHDLHLRDPDLVDVESEIRQQALGVRL